MGLTISRIPLGNKTAYRSDDQRPIIRNQESSSAMFRCPSARHEVERILTGAVKEVVLQISHGGLVKVVESTLLRTLSSSGEIGLKGAGSTVSP